MTTGDNNGLIALFEAALAARFEGPCSESLDSAEARRLRDHIESLSSAHRITVVEREMQWVDAWGEPDARKIVVPPLGSELAYFVALHEIGHLVLGLPSSPADDGEDRQPGYTTMKPPSGTGQSKKHRSRRRLTQRKSS